MEAIGGPMDGRAHFGNGNGNGDGDGDGDELGG